MARRPAPFVLLFQGRSGSSWIIDALVSHPAVVANGEALVNLIVQGAEAQIAWCRWYLTRPRSEVAVSVGFKTKLTDVLDRRAFALMLQDIGCRVIHLQREDLVRQSVSWLRADLLHSRTGEHNIREPGRKVPPTRLDSGEFALRYAQLAAGRLVLTDFVGQLCLLTHEVLYESLLAEPYAEFAKIQSFLGLQQQSLSSCYHKHTSNDLRRDVPNINELLVVCL